MNNENEIKESVLETEATVTSAQEVASTEAEENTEACESTEAEAGTQTAEDVKSAEAEDEENETVYPAYDPNTVWGKICIACGKGWGKIKEWLHLPTLTRKQKAVIFDKITTGILILLMATPILILVYILLWFLLK